MGTRWWFLAALAALGLHSTFAEQTLGWVLEGSRCGRTPQPGAQREPQIANLLLVLFRRLCYYGATYTYHSLPVLSQLGWQEDLFLW